MTFMDGQRPKSNRFTPKVLALVADGRSYRLIARELGLSKTPSSISSTVIAVRLPGLLPLTLNRTGSLQP
jgi:hypothetical protein